MGGNLVSNLSIELIMEQNNLSKYPALRTISKIFKISGAITLIIALIAFVMFLINLDNIFDSITFLPVAVLSLLSALIQFAIAELIKVVVDIEYNTRVKNQ